MERQNSCNADLPASALIAPGFAVSKAARHLLVAAADKLELSLRSEHRTLRVARTIADLEGADEISDTHLAEALSLREQPPHWRLRG